MAADPQPACPESSDRSGEYGWRDGIARLPRFWIRPCLALLCCALASGLQAQPAAAETAAQELPRHPLELRALVEPEAVLQQLPAEIAAAQAAQDFQQLALLYLAETNACRVSADWLCQSSAADRAYQAAQQADSPLLMVRGLILSSRASMALRDPGRSEQLLAQAQTLLDRHPVAELSADIQLAYSSHSNNLGKHTAAAEYAERGLTLLSAEQAPALRARLLRNRARALVHLGELEAAEQALSAGVAASTAVNDPKLNGELHLEAARLAGMRKDHEARRQHIDAVLHLAAQLKNSQLYGQAHEALALAALDQRDPIAAQASLHTAVASFSGLGLDRDEVRASRELILLMLDQPSLDPALAPMIRRFLELQGVVSRRERTKAVEDFDARLRYAQQQFEVARLENEARLAEQRANLLADQQRLQWLVIALGAASSLILIAFIVVQRRSTGRLRLAHAALHASNSRASTLLSLSKGAVFLHDGEGVLSQLNPAAAELFGLGAGAAGRRVQSLIAAEDQGALSAYLESLLRTGEGEQSLRLQRDDGRLRLLRISGRLASSSEGSFVVGHAIDITDDAETADRLREEALRDPLTGCFNRRFLEQYDADARADTHWAVINIDLDHFKQINDRQGHERGDQVLAEFAQFLRQRLRDGDALVRAGGDEFLIVLGSADEERTRGLMMRLQRDREQAPCDYSLGWAVRTELEPLSGTLARADRSMYERRREARRGDPSAAS